MTTLREGLARIRDWLRRDQLDAELAEELAFHRAQLERDAVAAGATPDDAAYAARRRLGSTLRATADARARWSIPALDRLAQDVRYAARGLRKSPGFTAAVVLTLGLGLGANATMFGIVDRLLFRPPALMDDPASAHRVYIYSTNRGEERLCCSQYARYRDIDSLTHAFSRVAGYADRSLAVGVGEAARVMRVGVVSGSFFGFFDAPPVLGRYFAPAEDAPPAGAPVVVLSHAMWQTRFGGRRDVLGATVQIGPTLYTVIGVAPPGFAGLWPERPPAAFIPLASYASTSEFRSNAPRWWTTYDWGWMSTIVRRKPGVTIAAADADLTNAVRRSFEMERAASPGLPSLTVSRPRAIARSILAERGPDASSVGRVATWVGGVSAIVLLIACANVANLVLARALRRRREIALRLALGVTRRRLFAQLLIESVILAALGGVAGLGVASWGGATLRALLLEKSEAPGGFADPRTVWYAVGVTFVVGVLTGLAPMLQARHARLTPDLKTSARDGTARSSRTRSALLVVQGALSVVLLVGAGLFIRSVQHVRNLPLGYDVDPVLLVELNMRGVTLDSARMVALRERLVQTATTVPGVERASLQFAVPLWSSWSRPLYVDGIDSVRRLGEFDYNAVSPEHFATLGTRIVRGRGVSAEDTPQSPRTMVVSESMGRALWPGRDPLGQCVRLVADTMPCTRVVGIAQDIRAQDIDADPGFYYYVPAAQSSPQAGGVFVRTRGDARRLQEVVRARLQREMPGAAYVSITPLRDIVGARTRSWHLGATMFAAFGAIALVIASIGLYTVVAYGVTQRMHELGIRIALGARPASVVRLVVREGMRFAFVGVALGTVVALLGARWLRPLLFHESPTDPAIYLAVGAVLLLVAIAASASPALRATRADPNAVLRTE